jgi:hypothetical protein
MTVRSSRRKLFMVSTVAAVTCLGSSAADGTAHRSAQRQPRAAPKSTVGILMTSRRAADVVTEARALGIRAVRYSQDAASPTLRGGFAAFHAVGLRLVTTANYQQGAPDPSGHRPVHPPVMPAELALWQRRLGALLDATGPTALLQVGNEEIAPIFFAGTMSQYVAQLNAAVPVAHARNVKVTNGGLTSDPVALLTWRDLERRGLGARADRFAARVFSTPAQAWILRDLRARPFQGLSRPQLQAAWDRAEQLIRAFRASRMDYVNFHWYHDDSRTLAAVVHYLQRATGKLAVTTEIGQHNTEPGVVRTHLRATVSQLHLPFVVWFDADGIPAFGLHDAPGRPRPNGEAFRTFVTHHRQTVR